MDIQKLQKLISSEELLIPDGVRKRIMENKMTVKDVDCMEKTIMCQRLFQIAHNTEYLVPYFQEATMRILELKNEGETEVDIDYVYKLLNDMTDWIMEVRDDASDFGITDVEIVWNDEDFKKPMEG